MCAPLLLGSVFLGCHKLTISTKVGQERLEGDVLHQMVLELYSTDLQLQFLIIIPSELF